MNIVVLVGRFANDPVKRTTQSGKSMATFALAVERRYKRDGQPDADFFNCIAWGRTAEVICQYFSKGRQIAVNGRLQNNRFLDRSGNNRTQTDVVIESFDFIGNSPTRSNNYNQGGYQNSSNNQNNYSNNYNNQQPEPEPPLDIDDDFNLLAEDEDVPF